MRSSGADLSFTTPESALILTPPRRRTTDGSLLASRCCRRGETSGHPALPLSYTARSPENDHATSGSGPRKPRGHLRGVRVHLDRLELGDSHLEIEVAV